MHFLVVCCTNSARIGFWVLPQQMSKKYTRILNYLEGASVSHALLQRAMEFIQNSLFFSNSLQRGTIANQDMSSKPTSLAIPHNGSSHVMD
mmetsp:Transcript_26385/g.39115  ORF Transcript_26385/g.39115 Transcript_26385/m.39115 type:complete len:91 (+) Transcript_26385:3057-3329(+)